ncbi:MAG: hypothetical protein IJ329_04005 [Clostridia bacterium]|nr:hypothetical protein [Clostridia bacterium]
MRESEMQQSEREVEKRAIERILSVINVAEKKARIYSRLLTEVSFAKAMEKLACRHEEQKAALQKLIGKGEKADKKQKGTGMDGENG